MNELAQELIRKILVRPFVIKNIHREILNQPVEPGVRQLSVITEGNDLNGGNLLEPFVEKGDSFYEFLPIGYEKPGEVEPLASLYNKILQFISEECGMILDITERILAESITSTTVVIGGKRRVERKVGANFEILTKVIWEEIGGRLMSELGHVIFAAGRPSVFHQVCLSPLLMTRANEDLNRITHFLKHFFRDWKIFHLLSQHY